MLTKKNFHRLCAFLAFSFICTPPPLPLEAYSKNTFEQEECSQPSDCMECYIECSHPAHKRGERIFVQECLPCGCAYQEATNACKLSTAVTIGLIVVIAVVVIGLANRTSSHH